MTSEFNQVSQPEDLDDIFHHFNFPNILNVAYWCDLFELTSHLDFDNIVEFGVGRGRSLMSLLALEFYYATRDNRKIKQIYAFDSFLGFPEPTSSDVSSRNPLKGDWSRSPSGKYAYSENFLRKVLAKADFKNLTNLEIVPGYFQDTCQSHSYLNRIGIMHLDGDLYESVKHPLDAFAKNIVKGGIIVIDDYKINLDENESDFFPGARLAVEEFLSRDVNFKLKSTVRGTPYLLRL